MPPRRPGDGGRTNLNEGPNFYGLAYQHAASDGRAVKDADTYGLLNQYANDRADKCSDINTDSDSNAHSYTNCDGYIITYSNTYACFYG